MLRVLVYAASPKRLFSGLEVTVIIIDFGKFGKAKLDRTTWLELLALIAVLAFVVVVVVRR